MVGHQRKEAIRLDWPTSQALSNWDDSRNGRRSGRRVGFPRFSSARRDPGRVRFTTGTMRLEDDRRTITLPVIGGLRSKENTRRCATACRLGAGTRVEHDAVAAVGQVVRVDRLRAAHTRRGPATPALPTVRAGVDLGIRTLATVSTIDTTTGTETVAEYGNPAPLKATLAARRRAGRELSRRIPGSRGHRAAKAKLTRLDRRCVHLRREAAHQLTTELARTYGQVVIEDLDVAAMKQGMGRRAFRRAVSDAAMGLIRPQLAYKALQHGSTLTVVNRWFASSQIHHGRHQPDGTPCRLVGKGRIDKHLICPITGETVDRDRNAARNLRDWPDYASCGPVGTTAPSVPGPAETIGWYRPWRRRRSIRCRRSIRKTPPTRGPTRRGQNPNPARGRRMSATQTHSTATAGESWRRWSSSCSPRWRATRRCTIGDMPRRQHTVGARAGTGRPVAGGPAGAAHRLPEHQRQAAGCPAVRQGG